MDYILTTENLGKQYKHFKALCQRFPENDL